MHPRTHTSLLALLLAPLLACGAEPTPDAQNPYRVIDGKDLVYFLSVIGCALFATGVIIRSHRSG